MLELALKLVANGLILVIAMIGWGLENRWYNRRTRVRRRWTRVLIVLLIAISTVDGAMTWHTHGQEQEDREQAARIEQDVQILVKLARERDPALTEQEALREVSAEIQALRGRTSELEHELEGVKRYGSVAKLNATGVSGKAGFGLTEKNSVLPGLESAFDHEQRDGRREFSLRCDEDARAILGRAAEVKPDFPFSYWGLAICAAKAGEEGWQAYAKRAVTILEHTTEIAGHHGNHDVALEQLMALLRGAETKRRNRHP